MKKSLFSWANLSTLLIGVFIVLMLFVPDVKAFVIRGLMKVGLFQPDIAKQPEMKENIAEFAGVTFQSSDGHIVHLNELKGKVVFLNFWATWCPPCIAEMPSINGLHEKLKGNEQVIFIMVDVDNNLVRSKQFMLKHKFELPLYQAISAVPEKLFAGTLPTTVIISKQGQTVFRHEGGADYGNAEVLNYINTLLK